MTANDNIDNGKSFDFGKTSIDYAKYRDIYPAEFYRRITDLGLCTKGQRVLDIGTGTGVLPRNMYKFGAKFTGVDVSAEQIEQAKLLSKRNGMDIEFLTCPAEEVCFPNNSFDVVTACQCFAYFDKRILLPKIHKLLKPGGHLCVLFMAWLPDESEIAALTERLILKYNPDWTGHGYKRYTPKFPDFADGLFELKNAITYDLDVPFTRESWQGRIRTCRGIGASTLTKKEIDAFEKELLELLETKPPVFIIPHFATILNLQNL